MLNYILTHWIEAVSTLTGIIAVYLNSRVNIWGWPIGIISVALSSYVFWQVALISDMLLHIIYVILGFYGWFHWLYGGIDKGKKKITSSNFSELFVLILIGIFLTMILGFTVPFFYEKVSLPYWDATTTSFSMIAQWQLAKKRLENWYIWIFVDILAIFIYLYKELYFFSFLFFIYFILCFYGYTHWKSQMREDRIKIIF